MMTIILGASLFVIGMLLVLLFILLMWMDATHYQVRGAQRRCRTVARGSAPARATRKISLLKFRGPSAETILPSPVQKPNPTEYDHAQNN